MIRERFTFKTLQEAQAKVEQYMEQYNPCGYGTHAEIFTTYTEWVVVTERYESCD